VSSAATGAITPPSKRGRDKDDTWCGTAGRGGFGQEGSGEDESGELLWSGVARSWVARVRSTRGRGGLRWARVPVAGLGWAWHAAQANVP
jgi:hypothetical protein